MDIALVAVVVPALAVVQAVFGVGLLLFGTPLFLMLGFAYKELLYILLPASVTLSLLQLTFDHQVGLQEVGRYAKWTVPTVFLGMTMSLLLIPKVDIRIPICLLLALASLLRFSSHARMKLQAAFRKVGSYALPIIAWIHGMTNMGGGLLAVYSGASGKDKSDIHRTISIVYCIFTATQLLALYMINGNANSSAYITLSIVGVALAYFLLGRRIYSGIAERHYQVCFSIFMMTGAGVLAWQVWK